MLCCAVQGKQYRDITLNSVDHNVSCALNVSSQLGGLPVLSVQAVKVPRHAEQHAR